MNEEKKENINNNQMDIFTKGFVKPPSFEEAVEKIEIEEDELQDNQIINDEFQNDIKYNNVKIKEKTQKMIKEFEEADDLRLIKQRKKRRRKNILLIIGIILELGIIVYLFYIKFYKETYYKTLTCTNSATNQSNNYTITMNNVYYFDKNDKVAKTENSVIYIFNDKTSYEKYKTDYIDTNIKNYQGIEQIDIFDDQNYAYENKTTYTYSKLKKNKNVTINNNLLTAKIENKKEPITIYIEDYNSVLNTNEKTGFICE